MPLHHESPKTVLSPELEQFTDSDKIAANKANYREFDWIPDRYEQEALERVRNMFLDINLSHATASIPEHLQRDGILPIDQLVNKGIYDWRSQTHTLDESLGLHRYVFLHWGAFHPTQNGRYIFPVDAREVLLSPNTIVTPRDINATMFSFMGTEASTLDEDGRVRLNNYLDTALSGGDWVEVIARRSLRYMQRTSSCDSFPIKNHTDMGEVKHLGTVPPQLLGEPIDIYDPQAIHPVWKSMIEENGVTVSYVTNALDAEERGFSKSDKDKLPHEIGADIEKSRGLWREILNIAQKS
ncbi:hypothetical protein KC952_00670 [Candidatus Saccharibacteria bacterium]|nr:hypothetical protein [Candidatus Saccharibacteria bacterium]